MFSPDDILTLSKAGFNAQQIAGLSMLMNKPESPAPVAPAPVAPAPAPVAPAPAPVAPAPAPVAPAPAPVAPAPAPENDPVLAELQKLTGLFQSSNIVQSNQPKVQTPEEILAEIINPPIKKE